MAAEPTNKSSGPSAKQTKTILTELSRAVLIIDPIIAPTIKPKDPPRTIEFFTAERSTSCQVKATTIPTKELVMAMRMTHSKRTFETRESLTTASHPLELKRDITRRPESRKLEP